MAASGSDTVSVVDRTRPIAIDAGIVAAHFLGGTAAFVLGEEAIVLARPDGEPRRIAAHGGAILATAAESARVVTAGDDGKIVATNASGETRVLASDPKCRWIDHVTLGPDGTVAWSAGKTAYVHVRDAKKELREFDAPSTVGGLAFFPKGFRLAIAHYNGATLWFPNAAGAAPEKLEWKGSHLGAAVSPDGDFWSQPCRSRCCMAGGSSTASTCGCRAMQRASCRCPGARAGSGSPHLARASSCCGHSRARTGRWARRPGC